MGWFIISCSPAVSYYPMADAELCKAAQVRLNITRNKLYTALIKEYFRDRAAQRLERTSE